MQVPFFFSKKVLENGEAMLQQQERDMIKWNKIESTHEANVLI